MVRCSDDVVNDPVGTNPPKESKQRRVELPTRTPSHLTATFLRVTGMTPIVRGPGWRRV